jgi:1,4-alpha-glucan branching enzyme
MESRSTRGGSARPTRAGRPEEIDRFSLLTASDLHWFNEGTHTQIYQKWGAHPARDGSREGTYFAVWAPNARSVSVIGEFNDWTAGASRLRPRESSGVFEGFVPGAQRGMLYKYHIESSATYYAVNKADPVGFWHEVPPGTASRIWDLDFDWADAEWLRDRGPALALDAPVSIYEVHLGSWQRVPEEGARSLTYREAAPKLIDYVRDLGYTHVEFLPLTEHPFYGSWGYEPTGLFAPTARYGSPQDLMALVDALHRAGIGVIFDWVPSHFPGDEHGLAYFDGTHLYEHSDPRQGFHPDWNTYLYNYGRNEVRSFLTSSATFWLDRYHADGLRCDGVASMLYLDYSRRPGEWVPNPQGGRENLDAIAFLRWVNEVAYRTYPGIQTVAEESTAWPMVSRPTYVGGLGFGYKWDMGWMHDTLRYFAEDPVHRRYHQDELTFRMIYAFNENFILPLSHDEVVYGKHSLLNRMPGDPWQKFANLRLLYAYMFAMPGKKLLFMGADVAQWREWAHDESLDWHLLQYPPHQGIQQWVRRLNRLYRATPALFEVDFEGPGFEWIDTSDRDQSVLSLVRKGRRATDLLVAVFNFTPVPRNRYRVGFPQAGRWTVLANSDDREFGGSGAGSTGDRDSEPIPQHGRNQSVELDLPPLGALFLTPTR